MSFSSSTAAWIAIGAGCVALLDGARTGVVVSAIQGRDYARIYMKELDRGRASVALSPEEEEAVEREPPAGLAAVDAAPVVTCEERSPRDLALRGPRHVHVGDEPDHVGPGEGAGRRPQRLSELLDHLRLALEHEHVSTLDRRHVQGLIARVQNENVLHRREK